MVETPDRTRACFPGFLCGMLGSRARAVNDEMKIAAAHAIASCVGKGELGTAYIIPSVFNRGRAGGGARGGEGRPGDRGRAPAPPHRLRAPVLTGRTVAPALHWSW